MTRAAEMPLFGNTAEMLAVSDDNDASHLVRCIFFSCKKKSLSPGSRSDRPRYSIITPRPLAIVARLTLTLTLIPAVDLDL